VLLSLSLSFFLRSTFLSFFVALFSLLLYIYPPPPPPSNVYVMKALRHGVLIDFENMDDASTKYCQFPFVLGALAAILSAILIMSEPSLSQFAKLSTLFLVVCFYYYFIYVTRSLLTLDLSSFPLTHSFKIIMVIIIMLPPPPHGNNNCFSFFQLFLKKKKKLRTI
jgi:hypothetical protein